MIRRIVQMTFMEDKIEDFKSFFKERKDRIGSFEGCRHLELWQDTMQPDVFITYSLWDTAQHLDQYRSSEFFKDTWQQTKQMFREKPRAWSVTEVEYAGK